MTRNEPMVYTSTGIDGCGKTLSAFKYSVNVGNREKKQLFVSDDTILDYDEVYFDSLARSQESEKTMRPVPYGISSIRTILVLHMLALFDENPELPDEYSTIFCDLFPSLNNRNTDTLSESIDRLGEKRTVWISNGPSFSDGFYQYGGSL